MFEDDDIRQHDVVRNETGQYSIWLVGSPVPSGWGKAGRSVPAAGITAGASNE
ncbi:MAG: MbtH family protein [Actinomycetota bacterium]|nr:MbtH family protein [Actinomycetota bacterium]